MNLALSTSPPPSIMDLPLSYIHMSCLKLQRTASYQNGGRDKVNSLAIMVISYKTTTNLSFLETVTSFLRP